VLLELLKILVPLIGGGLGGALVTDWLRRKSGRIQTIPLIERVNRIVDPALKGFCLARTAGEGPGRPLEEVRRVREYQLTLRNTSTVHLHNADVQFEFPTDDVQGWAERPVRSKTTPELLDAAITDPWIRGFRWRVPELPSTDSMEFTFRAVDPPSGDYEVALYNAGQVVVEKTKGEVPTGRPALHAALASATSAIAVLFLALGTATWSFTNSSSGSAATIVDWAGCSLYVTSSFEQVNPGFLSRRGPWMLSADILNMGDRECHVQPAAGGHPEVIESGKELQIIQRYSGSKPQLLARDILFGPVYPANLATVRLYEDGVR
jgi:hypothetical protein